MTIDLSFAQFLVALVGALTGGIGAYVAVRVELAKLTVKVEHAIQDSDDAHKRIDRIMRFRRGEDTL